MEDNKQQLNLGNIIIKTCNTFFHNFSAILIVTLIVYVPINVFLFLIYNYSSGISSRTYYRLSQLLEVFIGVIATLAITRITAEVLSGKPIKFSQALSMSAKRWIAAVLSDIYKGAVVTLFTFLLIIPGIIRLVQYAFVDQIVALKGLRNRDALNYSKSLVKGNWWKVFGYGIILFLIPTALGFSLSFGVSLLTNNYNGIALLESVVDIIIDLFYSFFTIGTTVLFLQLEVTKEEPNLEANTYEKLNNFINKDSIIDDEPVLFDVKDVEQNEEQ